MTIVKYLAQTIIIIILLNCSSMLVYVSPEYQEFNFTNYDLVITPINTGTFMEEGFIDELQMSIIEQAKQESIFKNTYITKISFDSLKNMAPEKIVQLIAPFNDTLKVTSKFKILLFVEEFSLNIGYVNEGPFSFSATNNSPYRTSKGVVGYAKFSFWDVGKQKIVVNGTIQKENKAFFNIITPDMGISVINALSEGILNQKIFKKPKQS